MCASRIAEEELAHLEWNFVCDLLASSAQLRLSVSLLPDLVTLSSSAKSHTLALHFHSRCFPLPQLLTSPLPTPSSPPSTSFTRRSTPRLLIRSGHLSHILTRQRHASTCSSSSYRLHCFALSFFAPYSTPLIAFKLTPRGHIDPSQVPSRRILFHTSSFHTSS